MPVKSTYNFVPAPNESEVYLPDWDKQVSHDIPFSDGESGEIEIKITAETPIFIRNGHKKDVEENEFSLFIDETGNKQYFIPATSLKGMFRNVLEIMTSSRMWQINGTSKSDPSIFGLRDMNNDEYSKSEIKNVKSGWLKKQKGKWVIYQCVNHRVSLNNIETNFKIGRGTLKGASAKEKYNLTGLGASLMEFDFSFVNDLGKFLGHEYNFDSKGDFHGSLVLFGDIDNKKYDYIFSKEEGDSIPVEDALVAKFGSLESETENSLWDYFVNKKIERIPVFFKEKINGKIKSIKHFGFSKLYRLNDSCYLNELNPTKSYTASQESNRIDLAELIFGQTRLDETLKGRVYFSNAKCTKGSPVSIQERVLNSPKASFYPAYLKQEGIKGKLNANDYYSTYRQEEAELRGFKRYPVHTDIKKNIQSDNENISSKFIPLDQGSIFSGKLRFHNLRSVELGALLSAITFHNNHNNFFHTIGGAKPFGFGKIKVEVPNIEKYINWMQAFEEQMNKHIGKKWVDSKPMRELTSMASEPKNESVDKLLTYPALEPINEFNEYKKLGEFLEDYAERNGVFKIESLLSEDYLKEKELKKNIHNKFIEELIASGDQALKDRKFDEAIKFYNAAKNEMDSDLSLISEKLASLNKEMLIEKWVKIKESKNIDYINEFKKSNPEYVFSENDIQFISKVKASNGIPAGWDNYNIIDFRKLRKGVPEWLNKLSKSNIPEEFVDEFINVLKNIIQQEMSDRKKSKDWAGKFEENNNYKTIITWIGEAKAKALYDELNSSQP